MTPDQYAVLKDAFFAADGLAEDERTRIIEERCSSDAEVLATAHAMLRAERLSSIRAASSFFRGDDRDGSRSEDGDLLRDAGRARAFTGPFERLGFAEEADGDAPAHPDTIGPFRIVRRLGAGATGMVYEAEQQHPRRRVAVKVLAGAAHPKRVLRRFEREADILAKLQHPDIAQVYASGIDVSDRSSSAPYIAMELVEGEPLNRWARGQAGDREQVLTTFARVCDAVHYAHQRGVIHRDLKPANVLVDQGGNPKVLDFGIARALEADLHDRTLHTLDGEILGTLAYMSPEQAAGNASAIDVRTDVYALGAVLHDVLCGRPPIATDGMPLAAALDAVRHASRTEPTSGAGGRSLPKDLRVVLGAALERDPTRRYASASALADDIRRTLRHEPILARAPSMSYELLKFARRRRAAVAAAGVIGAALAVATGVSIVFAAQASAALDREAAARTAAEHAFKRADTARLDAERERREAEATLGLLTDALAAADPNEQRASYTMRQFLADVGASLDASSNIEDPVEAQVRAVLGKSLISLGDPHEALTQLQRAVELRRSTLGPEHRDTLDAQVLLGIALLDIGDFDRGEALLRDAAETSTRVLGPTDQVTIDATYFVGAAIYKRGDLAGAEPWFRRMYELSLELHGADAPDTIASQASLALILQRLERHDEAEPLHRDAIARSVEAFGERHQSTLTNMSNLALMYLDLGRAHDAEPILRHVLRIREEELPPTHRYVAISQALFARALHMTGRPNEARSLALTAFETLRSTLGDEHPYTQSARDQLERLDVTAAIEND